MSSNPHLQVDDHDESARDAQLVARVRAGDETAFEHIFRQHHEALWRFAYHQVGCDETAREIVQDVFFALWRRHAEWEVTSSIGGWLYGAVRHYILRHRRNERTVTSAHTPSIAHKRLKAGVPPRRSEPRRSHLAAGRPPQAPSASRAPLS